MVVDIGGGTCEVAVISLGGIVVNHSLRIAGDEIDEAVVQFARREYNLLIGDRMAEKAKIAAGWRFPLDEEITVTLRGRDLITGLPKAVQVSSVELRDGMSGPVSAIVGEVRTALEETPPELVADIMEQGIMLAGGGALLHGLAERIRRRNQDAGAPGRVAAHVRGGRLRPQPRGVRGDPPQPTRIPERAGGGSGRRWAWPRPRDVRQEGRSAGGGRRSPSSSSCRSRS